MTDQIERLWADHHRPVLAVAYRLLGSVAEAEDVSQEAYTRLITAELDRIDDVRGWLITVTSRLCLDRLRAHEHSRRVYPGPWLPEPILGSQTDLADRVSVDDSVRMALLVVLEQLSPPERTAFVLHDVFGMPFDEVGAVVGRSGAACRQLASRARRRIATDAASVRYEVNQGQHRSVAERFASACRSGDLDALIEVLDPEVVGDFDSGGALAGAPLAALRGADRVGRQLAQTLFGWDAAFDVDDVNAQPGVVCRLGTAVVAVVFFEVDDRRATALRGIGNPAKLAHLNAPTSAGPDPTDGGIRPGYNGTTGGDGSSPPPPGLGE